MGMNLSMEQERGKRMKLFELICAVSLSVVFTAGAMSSIKPAMELYARTVELERKVDRDSFMTRGFVNVCEENDREHWVDAAAEWKDICLSLWPLDFLEYEYNDEFYSQTWKKDGFTMRVEWPLEGER